MDIVRILKFPHIPHLKATFENLGLKQKFFLLVFLSSLITTILPHEAFAALPLEAPEASAGPVLVFDTGLSDYEDYIDELNQELTDEYYQRELIKQALKQERLVGVIKTYLKAHNSPLADYASTLVSLRNWKKIVALSNAESSMCRKYPISTANCWGVGGTDLWDMGANLGEGVVAMNHFLNKYPRKSSIKYTQMSFERMNGLYKQPPAQHWVDNNQIVYDELSSIEAGLE